MAEKKELGYVNDVLNGIYRGPLDADDQWYVDGKTNDLLKEHGWTADSLMDMSTRELENATLLAELDLRAAIEQCATIRDACEYGNG